MFYLHSLQEEIVVEPRHFGPKLREHVENELRDKVEGKVLGKRGYVVCITQTLETSPGEIQDYTGWALFRVKFQCIIFRPVKGEVLDATTMFVARNALVAKVGPLRLSVPTDSLQQNGWEFDTTDGAWVRRTTGTDDAKITHHTALRLRITGLRYQIRNEEWTVTGVASIAEPHLGVL